MNHGRADYNRRIVDLDGIIPKEEPVLLIRAQDACAAEAVRAYAAIVKARGGDPRVVQRASDQADAIEVYQRAHQPKMPD